MQFILTCFVSDETGFDECGFILRGDIVAREDTQKKPSSPCNNAKNQAQKHKPRPMCYTVERLPINIEHLLTSNYTEISFYQLDKFKFS